MKKLTKQEPDNQVRVFIICLAYLAMVYPVQSQALHFVAVTWLSPDKQPQYEQFLNAVRPIWSRHNIDVLVRTRILDVMLGPDGTGSPNEITVLRVASRENFDAYLDDPAYKVIRQQRLDAVDTMIVLEGTESDDTKPALLKLAPQFAVLFDIEETYEAQPALNITLSSSGVIKGKLPSAYARAVSFKIIPLSFDDNPFPYLDQSAGQHLETSRVYIVEKIP